MFVGLLGFVKVKQYVSKLQLVLELEEYCLGNVVICKAVYCLSSGSCTKMCVVFFFLIYSKMTFFKSVLGIVQLRKS